ncbi:glucokinase [Candidatus Liberibacter americanus]|nr:glucokinase [Candidatus Liberibacter americanus]EMS36281.1 glucokinase [Candidatus Liberibacter americanus PW_SP]
MPNKKFPISFPLLLADIGGTNIRFAILFSIESDLEFIYTLKTSDYNSLEDAINDLILNKISIKVRLRSVFLAVAASIYSQDSIVMTNSKLVISPNILISYMSFEDVFIINDFEAQALAISSLDDSNYVCIANNTKNISCVYSSKVIIGPGTGLGVAGLIRVNDSWVPIAGEGGHMNIGPISKRDFEIFPYLTKYVDGRFSAESLLSGRGLVSIYKAVCVANGIEDNSIFYPEDILSKGLNPISCEAIDLFCEYLGRFSGDLALLFMARGGVYISGGISYVIKNFLHSSSFRYAFENKSPHKDLMRKIPIYLVTNPNIALLGMLSYIRKSYNYVLHYEGIKRRWY